MRSGVFTLISSDRLRRALAIQGSTCLPHQKIFNFRTSSRGLPSLHVEAIDALHSPWPPGLLCAFPPISLFSRVICKLLLEQAELILLAPHWPRRPWFADLVSLSVAPPWQLPQREDALTQGALRYPDLQWPDCLVVEWCPLADANIPADVIRTIHALRRPSMDRIYSATWRAFCSCCDWNGVQPLQASIVNILIFLQEGLSKGLSTNTLQRQVVAISLILTCGSLSSLSQHPLICWFLQGAGNLCPPVLHRYPTWDLSVVLNSLTNALAES